MQTIQLARVLLTDRVQYVNMQSNHVLIQWHYIAYPVWVFFQILEDVLQWNWFTVTEWTWSDVMCDLENCQIPSPWYDLRSWLLGVKVSHCSQKWFFGFQVHVKSCLLISEIMTKKKAWIIQFSPPVAMEVIQNGHQTQIMTRGLCQIYQIITYLYYWNW